MFYDVAIIGAGPSALAVAARLREKTPAALFTQDEHDRLWRRHARKESLDTEHKRNRAQCKHDKRHGNAQAYTSTSSSPSIVVLDSESDGWLSTWKKRFAELQITHLRSPLFFHPGPHDRDGLLAFAHEHGRTNELTEIENVVGKELSKHEQKQAQKHRVKKLKSNHLKLDGRDQIDYHIPSSPLFCDYCEAVSKWYGLQDIVTKATVTKLSYDECHASCGLRLFEITSSAGTYFARFVVVAVGPGSSSTIMPAAIGNLRCLPHGKACHIFDSSSSIVQGLNLPASSSRSTDNVIVVGGGLTSAQVIDVLLNKHNHTRSNNSRLKIHFLVRSSKLKVKPFDVDLEWVSKTRNHSMSAFYMADTDDERLQMLRGARNGGSITPVYHKKLLKHVAAGDLQIHTGTMLTLDDSCTWDDDRKAWTNLNILPPIDIPAISHIIFATGIQPGLSKISFLHDIQKTCPISTLAGLPVLTDDLAWGQNVPCFFTGALAALRLGPGAGNLMGARLGAERIAWAIEERMEQRQDNVGETRSERSGKKVDGNNNMSRVEEEYLGGSGSRFAVLDMPT